MNIDQALRSVEVAFPETPDVAPVVLAELMRPARAPWWRRPVVAVAAVVVAVVVAVVGLVPAARDQVASWLGIRGVTVETVAPPTTDRRPEATGPTTSTSVPPTTIEQPAPLPVQSGLGAGLLLGREIVSLTVEGVAGFEPLYPALGLPDREFVDAQGRAWMLYSARPGLPEVSVDGVGMIVAQFPFDTPGIAKQVVADGAEFVEFGDELFGLWVPGPHGLQIFDADGSMVDGRSAGNTLLWEQGDLTMRIETSLSLSDAVAIAESFG